MKQAVFMDEFSRLGGGQVLGMQIVKALSDQFRFDLITDRYHGKLVPSLFGKVSETRYVYHENINLLQLALGVTRLREYLKHNSNCIKAYDLSINNHSNIFLYNADINILHDPLMRESMRNGILRKTFLSETIKHLGIYSTYDDANFVVNGKYMLEISKIENRYLGISPKVSIIVPPVSYPEMVDFSGKKNIVLTFGRINPDKKLETVIEVAKRVNCQFIISGAVNEGSEAYYNKLINEKPENVRILKNPSELEKDRLLNSAKIYLHTRTYESFGLSVAEAIGHGCVPIVPKNGGPWIDIIEKGKYGYGYDTVDEAAEIIREAIKDDSDNIREIYDSRDRFSFQRFKEDWEKYVSEL